jgi:hypothetical protein
MKFNSIIKVAAAVMAVGGLVLTSCERPASKDDVFALAIRNSSVGSGKGQQFVNVKCSGEWTLALTSDQGEVNWARLSVTSGSGDKSNVVLSYDANSTEDSRTLKIVLDNGSVWLECSMTQMGAGQHPEDPFQTLGVGGFFLCDALQYSSPGAMETGGQLPAQGGIGQRRGYMRQKRLGRSFRHGTALYPLPYPMCHLWVITVHKNTPFSVSCFQYILPGRICAVFHEERAFLFRSFVLL